MKVNNAGDVFPIWGTCLGFGELLTMETSDHVHLESCRDGYGEALPLKLGPGWRDSQLLGQVISCY